MRQKSCDHINRINTDQLKQSSSYQCEECIKTGSGWVHLRTCQECGITLCCDSSPNQHATKHFQKTSHPVIISAEPGEKWLWCYTDKLFIRY